MRLGLNRLGLSPSFGGRVAAWSPAALFAGGEAGAWYDIDPAYCFTTSTGTTQANVGDPVGLLLDRSRGLVLGAEQNPGFASYTVSGTGTFAGGVFTDTVGGQIRPGVRWPSDIATLTDGLWRMTVVIASITGATQVRIDGLGGSDLLLGVGTHTCYFDGSSLIGPRFRLEKVTTVVNDGFTLSSVSVVKLPGHHATQATSAARPTLRQTVGGLYYLEFDGVDDGLTMPVATDGAVDSSNFLCASMLTNDGNFPSIYGGDNGFLALFFSSVETIRPAVVTTSGSIVGNGLTTRKDLDFVYTAQWDRSAGRIQGWVDSTEEVNVTGTAADKVAKTVAYLGRGTSASPTTFLNGRVYSFALTSRTATPAERASAQSYSAAKAGVTL